MTDFLNKILETIDIFPTYIINLLQVGDAFVACGGLPGTAEDHAESVMGVNNGIIGGVAFQF